MTEDELIRGTWLFERQDKSLSIPLRFEANGRIVPFWNDNEFGWRMEGQDVLILTRAGEVSTRFSPQSEGVYEGDFLLPWWERIVHRLVATPSSPDMQSLITVGSRSRSLIVSFNSLRSPFDGISTRWEMHNWVAGLEADSLRIAERGPDFTWYTDKTKRIRSLVSCLAFGYDRLIFIGNSSGGYASLLFGELVGQDLPGTQIHSFAINPQTVHHEFHRKDIADRLDRFWQPQMIEGHCLARADTITTELPDIIGKSTSDNIHHSIYYDSNNPVESYYISLLDVSESVRLMLFDLGLSHMDGVTAIYEQGLMQEDVRSVLSPKAS